MYVRAGIETAGAVPGRFELIPARLRELQMADSGFQIGPSSTSLSGCPDESKRARDRC